MILLAFARPEIARADPPGRVARTSFLSGSVSFRPAALDDWTAATLNYPVTTGDDLWTDPTGRAELQLGSIVARLASNTSLSVLNLDDRVAQFRLAQGTLSVSVRELLTDDAVEIDTPNGAVSLLDPGFYRIDVSLSGDGTTVTVRRGVANMTTGASAFDIGEGQSAVVTGLTTPRRQPDVHARPSSPLRMARQWGQISTRPRRGSEDTKFTRVRSSRATLRVVTSRAQLGQMAGYSREYSASLS